uniref:Chaperone DnaJ C-terminal domain-containing protein n=1 Tax=Nelumbo nucifera TaxID=4432 RepID=A0A822Y6P5_NELNU|nr:TPA_asm: hypothetical protein HUJ06_026742 [Nelumbo nucifera]
MLHFSRVLQGSFEVAVIHAYGGARIFRELREKMASQVSTTISQMNSQLAVVYLRILRCTKGTNVLLSPKFWTQLMTSAPVSVTYWMAVTIRTWLDQKEVFHICTTPHERFRKEGNDRYNNTGITKPKEVMKFKGQGMPLHLSTKKGDLYVTFEVLFPSSLIEDQKTKIKAALG